MIKYIGKYNVEMWEPDVLDKHTGKTFGLLIISVFVPGKALSTKEIGRKQFYYLDERVNRGQWLNSLTEEDVRELYKNKNNTKFRLKVKAEVMR